MFTKSSMARRSVPILLVLAIGALGCGSTDDSAAGSADASAGGSANVGGGGSQNTGATNTGQSGVGGGGGTNVIPPGDAQGSSDVGGDLSAVMPINDAGGDANASTDATRDVVTNPGDGGASSPSVGGCPIFPPSDPWNQNIATATVDATWTQKLYANALLKALHPDFGSSFGIPYNVVPQAQPALAMSFDYASDSDPGPYPFPGAGAKIEGGTPTNCMGDCHVLSLVQGTCALYEGWNCHFNMANNSWHCGSGAKFDLLKVSPGQRPKGWTSADAAGLAILPGLVRYDEVAGGVIKHAIRFTMHCTQDGFVYPASHQAVPNQCPNITTVELRDQYPPMGLRIRLKATYAISALPAQAKVVAQAMQTYGMILADNGSDYYFQGEPNPSFSDTQLNALKGIPGDAFEVLTPAVIER
jgi:hypothetical protein